MIRDDVLHDPRAMYQMAQQAPFCLKTSGDSAEQEDNCYRSHFASNRSREDWRGTKKDAPRGVPNDRYYNLARRSHLAISVQRRDSPRHQSPVFIITAQWRRHFTVGIHDPLQRRRPPTAQTGLLLESECQVKQPLAPIIHRLHCPFKYGRGEREIWSDDHYNLNPIGGNQRRHPNVFVTAITPHMLSRSFCAT